MCMPASPGTDKGPSDSCKACDGLKQGGARGRPVHMAEHLRPNILAVIAHFAIGLCNSKGIGREFSNSNNNVCIWAENRGFNHTGSEKQPI